jgi:uncharacterized membrane protein YhaH (DUF805 family)
MINEMWLFSVGIGLTAVSSFLVMFYMKPYLQKLLIDLCGTPDRANFWTAFSCITLILVPIICAMHFRPDSATHISSYLMIIDQLKWALIGLVGTVIVLGVVISRFIPRPSEPIAPGVTPS